MPVEILGEIKEVRTFKYASEDKGGSIKIEFDLRSHGNKVGKLAEMHAKEMMVIAIIMDEEEFDRFSKKDKK